MDVEKKEKLLSLFLVFCITIFLASYFNPRLILSNTTTVGGDTPAHNYMVKHLKESLFTNGSIISWANGWWCGFPMFQYYFFFPYFVMVLLSFIIPVNIAFKLVSISGILALPAVTYVSFRWLNYDKYVSLVASAFSVLYLFVDTHTMWGVNIYSTLAGEISKSISFLFFILFIASFYRDMELCKFRWRTLAFLLLVFFNHFFSTLIAAQMAILIFLMFGLTGFKARLKILLKHGVLCFLLVSWWLIPLIFKFEYSMGMGTVWKVEFFKTFPHYMPYIIAFAILATIDGIIERKRNIWVFVILLIVSSGCFFAATKYDKIVLNVRFWPFIFFSVMMLCAIGIGNVLAKRRFPFLLTVIFVCGTLVFIWFQKNNVKSWVKWNYEGVEKKANYWIFKEILTLLDGTPGRLANDLHDYNDNFGSTRIFEMVPAMIKKDYIEGGIMNSAASSMFTYYIQCESSIRCAGYPTVMQPTTFNIDAATKHMKIANVKHFVAFWEQTKNALLKHPEWKLVKAIGPYMVFELVGNSGRYIEVPKYWPLVLKTKDWKEMSMLWTYSVHALDVPIILQHGSMEDPPGADVMNEETYTMFLVGLVPKGIEVPTWLTLGPFYYEGNLDPGRALDLDPINISDLHPKVGTKQFDKEWRPVMRSGPIFLHTIYQPGSNFICYNYVNIVSEYEQEVVFHYSNDDGAKIYLNGELVVKSGITGLNNYGRKVVRLKAGSNHVIYQLQQGPDVAFFHLKITSLDGQAAGGIRFFTEQRPEAVIKPLKIINESPIIEEKIGFNRIEFRTKELGAPHLIKVSYFPNWKVKGAKEVYHVTPNFMLVYPEKEQVVLYYGSTIPDYIGRFLTIVGLCYILYLGFIYIKRKVTFNIMKGL